MSLDGRVALVTGGSRGIGRAITERLAAGGARVVFSFQQNAAAAQEVLDKLSSEGRAAHAFQADVSKPADVDLLVKQALETHGRVDILVNNAGITRDNLILRMGEQDWDLVLETNLKGAYLCTRGVLRGMIRQRYGRIVNISSVSGLLGNAGQANYAASKMGLIGLTRSVAREVASRGITANAVAPGFIETEIWNTVNEAARKAALDLIPLGRTGSSAEVAEAVAFLASDAAAYITGQVLNVDGGMVMG